MAPTKGRQNNSNKGKSNNKPTPVPRIPAATHGKQRMKLQETVKHTGVGYHQKYKEATLRFHNWMTQVACPGLRMSAVDDYRRGVDFIVNQNMKSYTAEDGTNLDSLIVAPPEIMASLTLSIRLRERVTTRMFGSKDGGDLGHRYIIDVLEYCRCALRFGNRIAAVCKAKNEGDGEEQVAIGGRFHALTLDDDEEEEEDVDWADIDRDIKGGNLPQYGGVKAEEAIDIFEALLKGDDSFQAMALLDLMEDLMEVIHDQYVVLKERLRGLTRQDSSCMQVLMESAVVANSAIECVQRAENEMMIDHPHLSSFSHVLTLVFLAQFIAKINKRIAKTKLQANPHMALDFVAEVFEHAILNGTYKNDLNGIVKRFVKKSGLTTDVVQHYGEIIQNIIWTETPTQFEQRMQPDFMAANAAIGRKPHMWLSQYVYIGGDSCLLNTHKIVRMTMYSLKKEKGRMGVAEADWFGKPFDENKRPARRILGDLDEPFMNAIIPELAAICRIAPFETLPNRSHLITVIDLLQRQAKGDPTKPLPVALTFGLHAVLTSIYVLQGQDDLARLAAKSKRSFDMLFEQLEAVADCNKTPGNFPRFYEKVNAFIEISDFAKSIFAVEDGDVGKEEELKKATMIAFWNPVVAGEYMLYATYICSVKLGSATVDSSGQLKFALHLHNGLKFHDPTIDVPFLRAVDTIFKNTKGVWVGGRPDKGSCYKAFWMSFGMSANQAARLANSGHSDNKGVFLNDSSRYWVHDTREFVIHPENFSSSYRRLVLQDLGSGNVSSSASGKHNSFLTDFISKISETHKAMDDDKDVLPLNFSAVGAILLEFVNALADHMGWSAGIQDCLRNTRGLRSARDKAVSSFDMNIKFEWWLHSWAHILSSVDNGSTENLEPEFDLDKIAAFTKSFFEEIKTSRYAYFVDEEETTEAITPRNPLDVSYPYGRTGRTPLDPLQGYASYHESKCGNPVWRLVIPGTLAPLLEGVIVYNGENKLKRGPRGKYRHIASYSLQELIDLQWDGSLTRSKTAKGYSVPFIPGYDSDSDDEYEPIDIERGRREGTIGLSDSQVELYLLVPGPGENGEPTLVQILK